MQITPQQSPRPSPESWKDEVILRLHSSCVAHKVEPTSTTTLSGYIHCVPWLEQVGNNCGFVAVSMIKKYVQKPRRINLTGKWNGKAFDCEMTTTDLTPYECKANSDLLEIAIKEGLSVEGILHDNDLLVTLSKQYYGWDSETILFDALGKALTGDMIFSILILAKSRGHKVATSNTIGAAHAYVVVGDLTMTTGEETTHTAVLLHSGAQALQVVPFETLAIANQAIFVELDPDLELQYNYAKFLEDKKIDMVGKAMVFRFLT